MKFPKKSPQSAKDETPGASGDGSTGPGTPQPGTPQPGTPHSGGSDTIDELAPDFAELHLPDELNRAIRKLKFRHCTPVQKEVLPYALDGRDIIAQAQTGTGKTAAFLISVIAYHLENPEIEPREPGTPFALAIAPTRELAMQIASDAERLSEFADLSIVTLVGGIDYDKQKRQLAKNTDIVVATPGRLLDFCRSKDIDLSQVETLIIDEADRMLSMGFIPDVKAIIRRTPHKRQRQTQLFSATLSEDIRRLAASWTEDAELIEIEPEQIAVESVQQYVYLTPNEKKYSVLYNLITNPDVGRVIVFVNRRDETRSLCDRLYRNGINCGLLTGEVPQKQRIRTLNEFKSGEIRVLVATDVAGRGIHVDNVSHVINYNLPEDPEDYIHRIGRTGRAGATGVSIALACEDDSFMLPGIEQLLGKSLDCQTVPTELLKAPPPLQRKSREQRGQKSNRRRHRNDRR